MINLKHEVTFLLLHQGVSGHMWHTFILIYNDDFFCSVLTALVLGVIGGIVLIGLLLLLIWKTVTSIHDRREYAKFEKERAMSDWNRVSIICVYKLQYALKQRH
jgi:hypothetical protein